MLRPPNSPIPHRASYLHRCARYSSPMLDTNCAVQYPYTHYLTPLEYKHIRRGTYLLRRPHVRNCLVVYRVRTNTLPLYRGGVLRSASIWWRAGPWQSTLCAYAAAPHIHLLPPPPSSPVQSSLSLRSRPRPSFFTIHIGPFIFRTSSSVCLSVCLSLSPFQSSAIVSPAQSSQSIPKPTSPESPRFHFLAFHPFQPTQAQSSLSSPHKLGPPATPFNSLPTITLACTIEPFPEQ
ncbi:hypothetical protein LZ30DRAFT_740149 [Colletotrichum cereale]|nr:hypothetical protein LZ30DRAFT_740149 [Colletotrichum cereale]